MFKPSNTPSKVCQNATSHMVADACSDSCQRGTSGYRRRDQDKGSQGREEGLGGVSCGGGGVDMTTITALACSFAGIQCLSRDHARAFLPFKHHWPVRGSDSTS